VTVGPDKPGNLVIRGVDGILVRAHFKERDYSIKPPVLVYRPILEKAIEEGQGLLIDLNDVFHHPNGEPMYFSAESNRPFFVDAELTGSVLELTPLRRGDATIKISANDGVNEDVEHSFRVLVYPKAFILQRGDFNFGYWSSYTPELTYPDHMLFLQSDVNDPLLEDALDFPYHIEFDEYHPNDKKTFGQPYNNTRRTRLEGLGADGISFINTGRGRDLGGLLLPSTLSDKKRSL
jgi:hypothetical protein